MNGNLAQFGEDLRLHLLRLQLSLDNLRHLFFSGRTTGSEWLANRMDELQKGIVQDSSRRELLRQSLEANLQRDAAVLQETITHWITNRQTARLHERADLLEQSAAMAVELASLAAAEAERRTITAVNARREAITVQIEQVKENGATSR